MDKSGEFIKAWATVFGAKTFNDLEREIIKQLIEGMKTEDIASAFIKMMALGHTGEGSNVPSLALIYEALTSYEGERS